MGYQFIHLETYSRKPDKGGRTVSFVLDEARREPAACQHVAAPLPPVVVFGLDPADVQQMHDNMVDSAVTVDSKGKSRRLRIDQHTLATVVASHPATMDEVRTDPATSKAVNDWERRTVDWLREQYGDRLVSVVRHADEAHPHLHAYLLPTGTPALRAKALHPGWSSKDAAVRQAKTEGDDGKAANAKGDRAYKKSMRQWQDSYWQSVGLPCGLTRIGPGRRRLPRETWQIEQAAARNTGTMIQMADTATREAVRIKAEVDLRLDTAAIRESKAAAAAEKAKATIIVAKARLAKAQKVADEAEGNRRRIDAEARKKARTVIQQAKGNGERILAEAESIAASLRRIGGLLGSIWSGFRSVEKKLAAVADAKISAAKSAAALEVAKAKETLRLEARQEVKTELAELRHTAERAERDRQSAENRSARLDAEARRRTEETRQAKAALTAEQANRRTAENERERFRGMWAEADNRLIDMTRRTGLTPKP
jgi:hypothetical protein